MPRSFLSSLHISPLCVDFDYHLSFEERSNCHPSPTCPLNIVSELSRMHSQCENLRKMSPGKGKHAAKILLLQSRQGCSGWLLSRNSSRNSLLAVQKCFGVPPQSRATESRQMEETCQLDDDGRCQANNLKRKLAVQQDFLPKFSEREGKKWKTKNGKKERQHGKGDTNQYCWLAVALKDYLMLNL